MSYLFKVIDTNRSGTITYPEFYKFFCKVVGEPYQQFGGGGSPKQQSPRQQSPANMMPQQQMYNYPPQQQYGGNMQPMGGMGGLGGMGNIGGMGGMPDPMIGMMMGGMGMQGMGGGMPMGVGMQQPYPQNQGMLGHNQAGFMQQGQNRRFPGMPAFTGNGWDF